MSIPPRADPGGTADRVRCAYCGANNFPASPTCWQCGRPLRPLSAASASAAAQAAPGPAAPTWTPNANQNFNNQSLLPPVNPGLAPKAAAALGLLFPWAGLPIGIAFLMLDDARKAKLGWIAIGWSIAGSILNGILFLLPLLGLLPYLKSFLPHPGGSPAPGGANGIPSLNGDDMILSLRVFSLFLFNPG